MFERKAADPGFVICKQCQVVLKYKNGSTSSMKSHAKSQHAKEWTRILEQPAGNQPKLHMFVKTTAKAEKYGPNSTKRQKLNRILVKFIAKDQRPISVVRNEGFRELIRELDPKYVLPSTQTIRKKLLPRMYNDAMKKLSDELNSAKYASLTTDGWTSSAAEKYNVFTIHWVDWSRPELKTKVLECAPFEERSTSANLEQELRRIINKFDLEKKLVLDVADNASDIQGALEKVGIPRLGCSAHKFNLAAKTVFEKCTKVKDLKTKCAKIVRTTKYSSNAKRALQAYLKRVGIQGKKTLVSFVDTRWNSFYLMMDRIRECKDGLILYLVQYNVDKENVLDEDDWELIEELCVILRPLWLATKELSGEQFTTLSKVVPMISQLLEAYTKNSPGESETAKEVRKLVADGLKKHFNGIDTDPTYTNATIYDPRFKNLVFSTKSKGEQAVKLAKIDAVKIGHEHRDVSDDSDSEMVGNDKKEVKGSNFASGSVSYKVLLISRKKQMSCGEVLTPRLQNSLRNQSKTWTTSKTLWILKCANTCHYQHKTEKAALCLGGRTIKSNFRYCLTVLKSTYV